MAVRDVDFLIVGGGVAAAKAAEGIRSMPGRGSVLVMTAEAELPYERPPLSKEFLRGEAGREKVRTHDEAWYVENGVELLLATRASTVDPATRTVTTEVGDQLHYGSLLLATGARPVRLGLPGEDLPGVHYLRTVDDSERLRDAIDRAQHLVVIGGGFIGAEVAASATQKDTRVTLLEIAETLWTRAVGPQMGRFFEAFLRDRGVDVHTSTKAARIEGDGRAEAVVLDDGTRLPADAVVVGVGVRPETALAEAAGLPVDDGILVDEHLRVADPATQGVYAAGDVARAAHPLFGRIRIEHWAEALNQGRMAGRNMAGADERYDRVPYFFSDQFDLSLSYLGHVRDPDEVVVRGGQDVKEPRFVAWYLEGGKPRAALIVNDWDAEDPVRAVIAADRAVDRARLADESVPLGEL
ncbi:MAG TPA: FAD-dependent oxidoreductase [Actinomycetes bacterium]|jgi:3-phenylpropionate/trans-cinnamate dioxygenase ferredoxin reductase subunit|nr:FAD-dependent oxidoreductase [Actinomycetes bacterium]